LLGQTISVRPQQRFAVTFLLDLNLAPGNVYHLTVAFTNDAEKRPKHFHWIDNYCDIECRPKAPFSFFGITDLKAEVNAAND